MLTDNRHTSTKKIIYLGSVKDCEGEQLKEVLQNIPAFIEVGTL